MHDPSIWRPPPEPADARYPSATDEFRYRLDIEPSGSARIAWASASFRDVTGFTVAEVNDAGGWGSLAAPDDTSRLREAFVELRSGRAASCVYRIVTADDEIRWLADELVPAPNGDGGLQAIGRARDVTGWRRAERGLRRSQELLSGLIDAIPDPVFVKDAEGMYLMVNAAAAVFLGGSVDDVVLRRDGEFFERGELEDLQDHERKVVRLGTSLTREIDLDRDGEKRTLLVTKLPYRDPDGEVVGIVGIARDVTSVKEHEAERMRFLERLVTVQEEQRRRIADDLHDDSIQVLTALALRLDLLRTTVTEDEQARMVTDAASTARAAIVRLRRMMFNLYPPSLERLGLEAAMRQLADRVTPESVARRVEVVLDEEPPLQAGITAFRIVQEALANVVKHSEATTVRIRIERIGEELHGTVTDDGIGFDVAEGRSKDDHYGLGAMQERAESAGGRLAFRSAPGEGTTVEFRIPVPGEPPAAGSQQRHRVYRES